MGKSLIIKGADFSANRVSGLTTWFYNGLSVADEHGFNLVVSPVNMTVAGISFVNGNLQGKTINCIKAKFGTAGTFDICIGNSTDDTNYTVARSITILPEEVGVDVFKTFEDLEVGSSKVLWIGQNANSPQPTGIACLNYYGESNTGLSSLPESQTITKCGTGNPLTGVFILRLNIGYTN